jgi:hypothetical protein
MAATCIYVSATVFPGHGLCQSDHAGLGSAVVGLPNVADDPGNRRDVDDPSLGQINQSKTAPSFDHTRRLTKKGLSLPFSSSS